MEPESRESAVARELSRYQYDVLVVEANSDVCEGTSKANSGIVHAGFDTEPGSMMAKMNIRGNEMMEQLSKDWIFRLNEMGHWFSASTRKIWIS